MYAVGEELLSGPSLSCNEDTGLDLREASCLIHHLPEPPAFPDDVLKRVSGYKASVLQFLADLGIGLSEVLTVLDDYIHSDRLF